MNKSSPFVVKDENESTGFLLWQVTALWQRRISAILRPFKLTQVQFALLASLLWLSKNKAKTNVTQIMLARQSKLDIMMTSQVLRNLEQKGLVKRQADPLDTRAKNLHLTKKGIDLVWQAVPMVEKEDAVFFKAIASKHREFNSALRILIQVASQGSSNSPVTKKKRRDHVE